MNALHYLTAVAALLTVAAPATVSARSSAPALGYPRFPSQHDCFSENGGAMVQVCDDEGAEWVMPLAYDNAGNSTISVSIQSVPGLNNIVSCRAGTIAWDGSSFRRSGLMETTDRRGIVEFKQASLNLHGWGSSWVNCSMDPGTRVLNYHW